MINEFSVKIHELSHEISLTVDLAVNGIPLTVDFGCQRNALSCICVRHCFSSVYSVVKFYVHMRAKPVSRYTNFKNI